MDGTDLLLGIMDNGTFRPLGHSTGCKITLNTETGDRTTKEAASAKWKEKYVKSLSCSVTAEGFVYDVDDDDDVDATQSTAAQTNKRGLASLRTLWAAGTTVTLRWKYRTESDGEVWGGSFIITSLEDDAPAGDDEKYSISFENNGPVGIVTSGGGGGDVDGEEDED